MAINLDKGQRVNLSKESGGAQLFVIGMGWDPSRGGDSYDLDACAFLCQQQPDGNPKLLGEPGFVFYKNLTSPCGGVHHTGDNLTGGGEGDDEQIIVNLAKLDPTIDQIDFFVTIYDAVAKRQNFGMVDNSFIRIVQASENGGQIVPGSELYKFDLTEDYSSFMAVQFGSLYKKDGDWRFKAMGQGYKAELGDIVNGYLPGAVAAH